MKTFLVSGPISRHSSHCLYCASTVTRLDEFGYCRKYDCLSRSGKRKILESLISQARNLYTTPDKSGQVGRVVSNPYSYNHRKADDLKWEAKKHFGFVPLQLSESIPMKFRHEKWDKNIRW